MPVLPVASTRVEFSYAPSCSQCGPSSSSSSSFRCATSQSDSAEYEESQSSKSISSLSTRARLEKCLVSDHIAILQCEGLNEDELKADPKFE